MDEHIPKPETEEVVVRPLVAGDLSSLRPVIADGIRDSQTDEVLEDEVAEVVSAAKSSLEGENGKRYLVASIGQEVIGIMGYKDPDEIVAGYAQSDRPAEIINAFVSSETRGKGVGAKLIEGIIEAAKNAGHSELLVNSGPRYEQTAWGFYDKKFGERLALLMDYYGDGLHAPLWRMSLLEE